MAVPVAAAAAVAVDDKCVASSPLCLCGESRQLARSSSRSTRRSAAAHAFPGLPDGRLSYVAHSRASLQLY